jgi:REP element-mobilizing transposase RayT
MSVLEKKRKYEYRRRLPHFQKSDTPLFITFRTHAHQQLSDAAKDLVLAHCRHDDGHRIRLHAVVIMLDHVHLLLSVLRDEDGWPYELSVILQSLKSSSAHSINRETYHSGPVWQDESFDHVLRSEESLDKKIEYIRQNPVRRGLVTRPEDYRWLWVEAEAG